jgi:hypothetical protein
MYIDTLMGTPHNGNAAEGGGSHRGGTMAKEHPGQWLRYTAGFAALAVAVIVGLGLARQDAFSFVVPLSEYVWEVLVVGPRMLHAFGLTHVESIRYVGETPVSLALVALPWVGGFLLALPIIAVARDLRPARRRVPWWDVLLIVQLAVSAFSASVMPVWGVSAPSLWRGCREGGVPLAPGQAPSCSCGGRSGMALVPFVELRTGLMALAGLYALLAVHLLLNDAQVPPTETG